MTDRTPCNCPRMVTDGSCDVHNPFQAQRVFTVASFPDPQGLLIPRAEHEAAIAAVVEKAVEYVQRARFGEADQDLRCIAYAIRSLAPQSAQDALQEANAEAVSKAIEWAVEWTIKQLSREEDWPQSWKAGFPSYKASALLQYAETRQAMEGGAR